MRQVVWRIECAQKYARRVATSARTERGRNLAKEFPLYAEYSLRKCNVNMTDLIIGKPEALTGFAFHFQFRPLPFKTCNANSGIFRTELS